LESIRNAYFVKKLNGICFKSAFRNFSLAFITEYKIALKLLKNILSNTILQEIMLIVTGMPGSGKDEFVQVAKQLGWMDVHMGNTVKGQFFLL